MRPVKVEYITPGVWEDDEPAAVQPDRVAYSEQAAAGLVRSGARSFVHADPKPITPRRVEVLPPATMPETGAPLSRAQSNVTGTFTDRAAGFALVTSILGATLGSLGVTVAALAWGVPLLSVAAGVWFGSLFAGTWFCAYLVHVAVSPEASGLIHVLRGWRWLDREQQHRHYLERRAMFPDDYRGRK